MMNNILAYKKKSKENLVKIDSIEIARLRSFDINKLKSILTMS